MARMRGSAAMLILCFRQAQRARRFNLYLFSIFTILLNWIEYNFGRKTYELYFFTEMHLPKIQLA